MLVLVDLIQLGMKFLKSEWKKSGRKFQILTLLGHKWRHLLHCVLARFVATQSWFMFYFLFFFILWKMHFDAKFRKCPAANFLKTRANPSREHKPDPDVYIVESMHVFLRHFQTIKHIFFFKVHKTKVLIYGFITHFLLYCIYRSKQKN